MAPTSSTGTSTSCFATGLPLLSPVLLWTAPIIYAAPEEGVLAVVNRWNPLTYLINIPRQWLVLGATDNDSLFLVCAAMLAALSVLSPEVFQTRHANGCAEPADALTDLMVNPRR